ARPHCTAWTSAPGALNSHRAPLVRTPSWASSATIGVPLVANTRTAATDPSAASAARTAVRDTPPTVTYLTRGSRSSKNALISSVVGAEPGLANTRRSPDWRCPSTCGNNQRSDGRVAPALADSCGTGRPGGCQRTPRSSRIGAELRTVSAYSPSTWGSSASTHTVVRACGASVRVDTIGGSLPDR